jgi:hypothetical protein
VGSGGRSADCGSDAPGSGAVPGGGGLRPGRPRAVRPDPGVHVPGRAAAARRPPACCPWPDGRRRVRGDLAVGLAMLTAAVADLRAAQHHAAQAAAARRAAEHLRGAALNHRPRPGPSAEIRVRAPGAARMDVPPGLTVPRQVSREHSAPRRPTRLRLAARRARPPPG